MVEYELMGCFSLREYLRTNININSFMSLYLHAEVNLEKKSCFVNIHYIHTMFHTLHTYIHI